jgi:sigma-B regulation protein RsbQ
MWRFITPAFEKDYRIVVFDYVGSGKSVLNAYRAARYSDLYGYALDILEIREALGLTDIILVGHSVSATIAILASIQAPEYFQNLILITPSPRFLNDTDYAGGFERDDIEGLLDIMEKNYIGWASFLAPLVMKNEDRPELTSELENSFCSTDPTIATRFAKITFLADNREDLPKVTVPSLILQCSEDALAPIEVGYYLHRHLSRSVLKILEATGHCPHMSHPEETIEAIREYLSAVP